MRLCKECSLKFYRKRFLAMPEKEWDGDSVIYYEDADIYFNDEDYLIEWCIENKKRPSELELVHCEPGRLRILEDDYWADNLPEEGKLPKNMLQAIDDLNKVVRATPAQVWLPCKIRVSTLSDEDYLKEIEWVK